MTTVGGTSLRQHHDNVQLQAADSQEGCSFTSGGGFSTHFKRPQYQQAAVQHYLATTNSTVPDTFYDRNGRGYPDLAILSTNFLTFEKPRGLQSFGSTSASATALSAVVALLNQQQLANHKPTLGFLNPLLYGMHSSGFVDIIRGNNACSRTIGRLDKQYMSANDDVHISR